MKDRPSRRIKCSACELHGVSRIVAAGKKRFGLSDIVVNWSTNFPATIGLSFQALDAMPKTSNEVSIELVYIVLRDSRTAQHIE